MHLSLLFERRGARLSFASARSRITANVLIAVAAITTASIAQAQTKISTPARYEGYGGQHYDGWRRSSQYVAARDGVRLAVDVIRPTLRRAVEEKPLPVIWIATQYQRARYDEQGRIVSAVESDPALLRFNANGYVIVVLEMRGTGVSFGVKHGADTANSPRMRWDLYDVASWIGKQPWSNGNIGMYGISFVGSTQVAAGLTNAPHLKCIAPQQTTSSSYRGYMNINGIQNKTFRTRVDRMMRTLNIDRPSPPVDEDKDGSLRAAAVEEHKKQIPSLKTLLELPYANSWSELLNDTPGLRGPVSEWPLLAASGIKIYHWGGWQDLFPDETLKLYATFKDTNPSRVVMGPWFHSEQPAQKDAQFDYATELLRWYDYCLKGIDNGIGTEPPVLYYTENSPAGKEWRAAKTWPLPNTQHTRYYFAADRSGTIDSLNDGTLTTKSPPDSDVAHDRYRVDYSTSTTGLFTRYNKGAPGDTIASIRRGQDWRAFDRKALTYTSNALARDTEITGHPVVHLRASVDTPDADFFVYLQEVTPDNKSLWVTEGFIRASNRATGKSSIVNFDLPHHPGFSHLQEPMPGAGKPVQLDFEMLPISRVFKQGSRIRVAIVGYDKDNWESPELSPAPTIALYRNSKQPSFVTLPIIPQ